MTTAAYKFSSEPNTRQFAHFLPGEHPTPEGHPALGGQLTTNEAALDSTKPRVFGVVSSRDEMNLAEFPLAVLSTRANPSVKTLEFKDTQKLKSGEIVERKWIITGADKFGLPTSTDDDVVLGLMRLSMDHGFRERKVYFTRYELLKILRWSTEGRSYTRLTKSLDRLSGVRIRASNAFFDNSIKGYKTRNFGLIDAYEINDGRSAKQRVRGSAEETAAEPPKSYFIWSEALFDSFKAGFIKKLDLDMYFSLRSAVSRRLYRYLDKHFYYRRVIEKSLMSFAFEKLGLSRNYKYVSSIKQQIEPAARELIAMGFLADIQFYGAKYDPMVRFVRAGEGAPVPQKQPRLNPDVKVAFSSGEHEKLGKMLAARGIPLAQAGRLLVDKEQAVIEHMNRVLRYYDHLVVTRDQKISKNPVGFLYRAMEEPHRFSIPAEFSGKVAEQVALRPECRVVRAESENTATPEIEPKRAYRQWLNQEIARARAQMGERELQTLTQAVEHKVRCLKDILDQAKYQEALEGCVREEIGRKSRIPGFAEWSRTRKS